MATAKRNFSSVNKSKFVKKLETYDSSCIFVFSDVDSAYEKFIQQFCTIFDEYFLITSVTSQKKHGVDFAMTLR